MRSPTKLAGLVARAGSTRSIGTVPDFRKPNFQLRDRGASSPLVSVSRTPSPCFSTHPVIVTVDSVPDVAVFGGAQIAHSSAALTCARDKRDVRPAAPPS